MFWSKTFLVGKLYPPAHRVFKSFFEDHWVDSRKKKGRQATSAEQYQALEQLQLHIPIVTIMVYSFILLDPLGSISHNPIIQFIFKKCRHAVETGNIWKHGGYMNKYQSTFFSLSLSLSFSLLNLVAAYPLDPSGKLTWLWKITVFKR